MYIYIYTYICTYMYIYDMVEWRVRALPSHARPFEPQSKVIFWKILSTFGDQCPQNGSKNGHGLPPRRACGPSVASQAHVLNLHRRSPYPKVLWCDTR